MAHDPLTDEDEQYASSEDSDFAPDDAAGPDLASEASDSDADAHSQDGDRPSAPKRKRAATAGTAQDGDFDNSGDEAVIQKGKKRRKKKGRKRDDDDDEVEVDGDGGDGGLIKTRSMRAAEKAERKVATSSGPVTIDVDALWERMKSGQPLTPSTNKSTTQDSEPPIQDATPPTEEPKVPKPSALDPPDMVRIKRKYNFAGKIHTEEKLVPRDSAEAKLYLASLQESSTADQDGAADAETQPRAPPRRAFRSAFEPALLEPHQQRRGDLNLGVAARLQAREDGSGKGDAKKLNTVEKSRMDWAGFVDKEGIKDELELAGRSRGSYGEREGFLARSEARREEEARRARSRVSAKV